MGILAWVATFVVALLVALPSKLLMLALGVMVHDYVMRPLAIAVGAILATMAAAWVVDDRLRDGTRTRLLPAAAMVGVALVLLLGLDLLRAVTRDPRFIDNTLLVAIIIALVVTTAVLYRREEQGTRQPVGRDVLILLGIMIVGVPLVIGLAALAGLTAT